MTPLQDFPLAEDRAVLLRARGLTKSYPSAAGDVPVLHGVDLELHRGEFLVVMGASGSGKSTLLHCLSGMDRPTSGRAELEGRELTGLSDSALSRVRLTRMGFVFQQPHLLETLSLRDNILLPALRAAPRGARDEAADHVDALMERFGIADRARHGITQVSGGQLQRAAICRALAGRPALVVADEPTGALNTSMTREVMDTFTAVHREGASIVMVTHDPAVAARADRVVYLRDGLVVDEREQGSWSEAAAWEREGDLAGWLRGLGF